MPRYQELLALIRSGKSPKEIMKAMPIPPSRMRRLKSSLKIERELTGLVVSHCTVTQVHDVFKRFVELMEDENPETARKVCLALINEGLQSSRISISQDDSPDTQQQPRLKPWTLLKPATAPPSSIGIMPKQNTQTGPSEA